MSKKNVCLNSGLVEMCKILCPIFNQFWFYANFRSIMDDESYGDHLVLYVLSVGLNLAISVVMPWGIDSDVEVVNIRHDRHVSSVDVLLVHDRGQHYSPTVRIDGMYFT